MIPAVHPADQPGIVPAPVHRDAEAPARRLRRLARRELIAIPEARDVQEEQIPRLQPHVLDHALHLLVQLDELRKVVGDATAAHERSLRRGGEEVDHG